MSRRQTPGNALSRILKPWQEAKTNLWVRESLDGAAISVVGMHLQSETRLVTWDFAVWNPKKEEYIDGHELVFESAKISADTMAARYGYCFVQERHLCMI